MRILSGWKEIATHLNHGVRAVQRWEIIGLPVHRTKGAAHSKHVMAFAEELDDWSKAAPMQLLDVITDLKLKVLSLEAEVLSLKGEVKGEKLKVLTSRKSAVRSGLQRRSVAVG